MLARAGGSDFPEEATACSTKARELMVRYAAVPQAPRGPGDAAAQAASMFTPAAPPHPAIDGATPGR
ncbi:MAG: DUF2786 domain-containing protein [Jatrophihabitans sp.]